MRTRNAVALSLQASSRVMKKVMSYQWYLWVYGSMDIKEVTTWHIVDIYIYWIFLSPLKFVNSPDRWEFLQKICDPWSHLTRVCHIKCSISGWSAYEKKPWRPWRNVETIRFMDYDHDPNMRSARPYIDASPCSPSSNNWTLLWIKVNLRFSDTLPTWFRSWDINLSSMARETIDLPCLARFSKLNKTLVKVLSDPHSLIRGFSWILPFVNQFARGNQHFS